MKPSLIVMAAGMGSRYGGLKQIDPVGPSGQTIMDYSIHDALAAGFGKIVFIIRRDIETDFRAVLGGKIEARAPVEYVCQELDAIPAPFTVPAGRQKPWGTGQAILAARDVVAEPFGVINADDFYGAQSFTILHDFLAKAADTQPAEFSMVGYQLRNTLSDHGHVSRGLCQSKDDRYLDTIVELAKIEKDGTGARCLDAEGAPRALSGDEWVSMNMWGFTPGLFETLDRDFRVFLEARGTEKKSEYLIPTVVGELIDRGEARVRILPSDAVWFGVTYPEDKPLVMGKIAQLTASGVYPETMWT